MKTWLTEEIEDFFLFPSLFLFPDDYQQPIVQDKHVDKSKEVIRI